LNEKKFKEVTEKFTKNVDKINENLLYLIDKNLDKISKCKNDIEISKNKNESLQKTLKELNDNCTKIENEIRQRNDEINSLQVKFSIYEKIKPIFEEIINVFPGRDPKELINKIKFSKDENVAKIEQINRITDKINEIENDTKKNTLKQNKTKQELVHKITELQLDIESKNESYKREISDLENEIKIYKNYQKENFKTNNLLYQLFLDIISKIQKEKYIDFVKDYGKDPSKRENFDAGIYNEKKFNDLLANTLLKYVTRSKGAWQLRQIIAYANMLIRNYLEKKKKIFVLILQQRFENLKI
jgi:chromosome segregation ATPase